jgi:ABC-type glycerol-3-phosphate transport system permease component
MTDALAVVPVILLCTFVEKHVVAGLTSGSAR